MFLTNWTLIDKKNKIWARLFIRGTLAATWVRPFDSAWCWSSLSNNDANKVESRELAMFCADISLAKEGYEVDGFLTKTNKL